MFHFLFGWLLNIKDIVKHPEGHIRLLMIVVIIVIIFILASLLEFL